MKTAVKGASKWLIEKATANKKLNPIPYALFKTILNKQIEWARSQRGQNLNFDELAELVKAELLKSGIHTMTESIKRESVSLFDDSENGRGFIPPLC